MEVVSGDNWSYKTCKAPVKLSAPTNQQTNFLQTRCPFCRPTNSVRADHKIIRGLLTLSLASKGSWLPWRRVANAKTLVSPLTPVPKSLNCMTEQYSQSTLSSLLPQSYRHNIHPVWQIHWLTYKNFDPHCKNAISASSAKPHPACCCCSPHCHSTSTWYLAQESTHTH